MNYTAEIAASTADIMALDNELISMTWKRYQELCQRAERAEARIAELEQAIKRQAAASLAGMNAAKAVSSWEMQEARRLKAESSPASVASQREANDRLTNELEAAQSTIAELRGQVERMREAIILHIADLELTADRVSRCPGFEKTVDQFRLAATELRAALEGKSTSASLHHSVDRKRQPSG